MMCWQCRQPEKSCYCSLAVPFESGCDFVILIHPRENRRRIATGRMAHRLLTNSFLFEGEIFDDHPGISRLLADPKRKCLILYPDRTALDIDASTDDELRVFSGNAKRPTIFLIDGTWATAKRTMRLSSQLAGLARLKFSPQVRSRFQSVRKQPASECLSTIEAIHELIERLNTRIESRKVLAENREHDRLLNVFVQMVERQASFLAERQAAFSPASPRA
jgi:DTW domain-containing protein